MDFSIFLTKVCEKSLICGISNKSILPWVISANFGGGSFRSSWSFRPIFGVRRSARSHLGKGLERQLSFTAIVS